MVRNKKLTIVVVFLLFSIFFNKVFNKITTFFKRGRIGKIDIYVRCVFLYIVPFRRMLSALRRHAVCNIIKYNLDALRPVLLLKKRGGRAAAKPVWWVTEKIN